MILGIVGGWHDLFCDRRLSCKKKKTVKKHQRKNVFFVKNDLNLADSKSFKICFFFNEAHKQVSNILLNKFQSILGWNEHMMRRVINLDNL